ncbi:MAG: tRNA lysidine(34) synthetase TilS [Mycobacteriales bacterium]
MTGPPAATAALRVALRRTLARLDGPIAAAVSGGADSLALAAGLAFERPGSLAFVVDHALQEGSAAVAARAAKQCADLGLLPDVLSARSSPLLPGPDEGTSPNIVAGPGAGMDRGGPEALARGLRYQLIETAAARVGATAVLLGHTLDDQAETVLLGLSRGSGARALAGMAAERGIFRRPLLELDRATVRQACLEAGLEPWEDPHNTEPAYARVRVRSTVLPVLERALGPGVAAALARSARQLREDADALDGLAPLLPDQPSCADLSALPPALRSRALKSWAEQVSCRAVTAVHVDALRALVEQWSGQGPVDLPGGVRIGRTGGRLTVEGRR